MKLLIVLLGVAAFAASVSARCRPFYLKIAKSPNTGINRFYLENQRGVATFNAGLERIVGCFSDTSHELFVTPPNDRQNIFLLVPVDSSGVENLLFGDHSAGARSTDFKLRNGYLTYGNDVDRFVAFQSGPSAGWVIRWVPQGVFTTENGFQIDLQVEWVV